MAQATQAYHKRDLYSDVTARILTELETGAAPWIKPWSATPGLNHPHNAISNRPYSGCNVVLLWMAQQRLGWNVPRYVTFRQAQELGGTVKKGKLFPQHDDPSGVDLKPPQVTRGIVKIAKPTVEISDKVRLNLEKLVWSTREK
jgi:hypothetical protein